MTDQRAELGVAVPEGFEPSTLCLEVRSEVLFGVFADTL